jgi:hypothetical protein
MHGWKSSLFVLGSIASMLAMFSYCMMLKATGWQFFKNYDVMCLSISDYALCTWEC